MCIDEKTSLGCEGFCSSIEALERENATLKAWNKYYYDEYITLHNDYMNLLSKIEKKNQEIQYLADRANKTLIMQRERLQDEILRTLKTLHPEE